MGVDVTNSGDQQVGPREKSSAPARKTPPRSRTLELVYPLHPGTPAEVTAVTIKRLKWRQVRAIREQYGEEWDIHLIGAMTGLTVADIDQLEDVDGVAIEAAVQGFLGASPPTGGRGATS